jgi:hypothetical protein
MKYDYDEQIAELTAAPEKIYMAWESGKGLFRILEPPELDNIIDSGCLTMIRKSPRLHAYNFDKTINEELSEKIRQDERLPSEAMNVTPEHLPIFKQYQEEYDEMLEKQEKELTN